MSFGPLGMVGSIAGSPLAQSSGSDVDRAQTDQVNQSRQTQSEKKAEQAAGIGQTEQDEGPSDRDADGRRPWEIGPQEARSDGQASDEENNRHGSRDPSGQLGGQIDLSG